MSKYNFYTIIISLSVLIVLIGFFSYAALTPNVQANTPMLIVSNTGVQLSFTATGGGNISQNITYDYMPTSDFSTAELENANVIAKEALNITNTIKLTLGTDGPGGGNICCYYRFAWQWATTSDATKKYTKTTGATQEYRIKATNGTNSFEYEVPSYTTTKQNASSEYSLCNYVGSTLYQNKEQNWTINTVFYNLNKSQNALKGVSFTGTFFIDSVRCVPV